ncbi:MAG: gamma-glutamyltransferase, partial [Silvibacterium sp.]|nr:gamma-glutamyltransferase [Silvibacterium sp.]
MSILRPAALLVLFVAHSLSAQDRSYGRSVVATQYGMVATSQVSASQAGALILERGGSAIDAGIAANAVLNVTEPTSNGMGGDLFAIYWEAKTGKLYGLNASGWAPKTLTIDHLRAKGITEMPQSGIDSVTVPGAVDGWAKLHDRWGKLPWRDLFQPAIFYADRGFPIAEIIHAWWEGDHDGLLTNPESTRVFLPGGKVPETGEIFRNPDVAHALTLVANQGESAFYKGEIAQAILKTSQELGGAMTADDLGSYSAEWVEPISTKYRDWTVYELPPNGDGIAALEMLNIMERFKPDPSGPHSPGEIHTRIEAMKLAYADVKKYDGDPRFSKVPVEPMLSKEHAAQRAKLITERAQCAPQPSQFPELAAAKGKDTIYMSAIDKDGNIVSL